MKNIIIVILVVIVVGGGIWFLLNTRQEQPLVPEEPVITEEEAVREDEDKTATWQIYSNKEYGYEIKYPVDWHFEEEAATKIVGFFDKEEKEFILIGIDTGFSSIDEVVAEKEKTFEEEVMDGRVSLLKEKIIGPESGYKIITTDLKDNSAFDATAIFFKEGKVCIIVYLMPKYLEVFDEMLSTFRFLD